MRLIDADIIMVDLDDHADYADMLIKDIKEYIAEQPTVDAVEVVRCKDCEYFSPFSDGGNGCYNYAISVSPDHFCSSAKRRTDE